jgi:hypothetical protein
MRQRDQRSDPESDRDQKRRPVRKSGMSPMVPVLIGAVVVMGIGLSFLGKSEKAEAAAQQDSGKPKPFADLPPEAPPERGASGSSKYTMIAKAPEGLMSDANWLKAVEIATEGTALVDEAKAAMVAQDRAKLNEKGKLARDKLNEAVDMTAAWEEELLAKYGDANAEIRRIAKVRSGWIENVIWLHKSIAR